MLRIVTALFFMLALAAPSLAARVPGYVKHFQAGIEAVQKGDYPTAVTELTEAIDSGKLEGENLANAHMARGFAYAQLKQCNNAIPDFTKALETKTTDAQIFAQRGNCYMEMKQIEPGLADLKQAVALAPEDKSYAEFLCASANNAKVYAEAGPACEAAVKKFSPQDKQLIRASAQAYELSGNKPKANEMWKMLAALDPADKDAKDGIARTK
jgi:tetratricopeptide (TPR) repeat protein